MTDSPSIEDSIAMYIVVRKSLGMSSGKLAAQVGHAVQMFCLAFKDEKPLTEADSARHAIVHQWLASSYPKILLGADEKEWVKVRTYPETFCVVDLGRTELEPNTETVVAFWPMWKSARTPFLKRLQTLK